MDLQRYNEDDIHEMRVMMAEKYRNMSKEEAEKDFQRRAENTRRAIEELRRQKQQGYTGPTKLDHPLSTKAEPNLVK